MEGRSSFVGRGAQVDDLAQRIVSAPLTTVVGPAGVGKTRLALRVAEASRDEFPDGVHVVELATVRTEDDLAAPIASSLGHGSFEAALNGLADHSALVVIDNCEHVLDDLAGIVETLLDRCPDLRILATSRAPLEIDDETVVPLSPLTGDDAVALLRDRAEQAGARLERSAAVDVDLARLTERVDRLPLGIELAARRLRSLGPADVIEALTTGDISHGGRAARTSRHRSLHRAIEWSYALLDERLASVFRRLAIFEAPFTVQHAHAVAAGNEASLLDTADAIDQLNAASMIARRSHGSDTMYSLLETLRRFAWGRLIDNDELDETRSRYVEFVSEQAADIVTAGMTDWSDAVVQHARSLAPDLLVAMRLCVDDPDLLPQGFAMFVPAWGIINQQQAAEFAGVGRHLLRAAPDSTTAWWPDAAAITATALMRIGRASDAVEYAHMAIDAGGGLVGEPIARRVLALVHQHEGRWTDALDEIERARALVLQLGLQPFADELDVMATTVLTQAGRLDDAAERATATVARVETGAMETVGPWIIVQHAYVSSLHTPAESAALLQDALARIDPTTTHHHTNRHLALLALSAGDHERAAGWFRRSYDTARDHGDLTHRWATAQWVGIAAAEQSPSSARRAAPLLVAARSAPLCPALGELHVDRFDAALQAVGDDNVVPDDSSALVHELIADLALGPSSTPSATATGETRVAAPSASMTRRGNSWSIEWNDERAELAASKGLADIARLVGEPDHEIHALDLIGALADQHGVDDGIDSTAKARYEERLRELQSELEEAEAHHDVGRAERAQIEFDQIVDELTRAHGLGGRQRTTGDAAERARSTVTWRIRAAIKKIYTQLPSLARHLRAAVRTGTWCQYAPEHTVDWSVSGR
ncbi:MAG: AAA family ATPase [Actinomycetota bacterium]